MVPVAHRSPISPTRLDCSVHTTPYGRSAHYRSSVLYTSNFSGIAFHLWFNDVMSMRVKPPSDILFLFPIVCGRTGQLNHIVWSSSFTPRYRVHHICVFINIFQAIRKHNKDSDIHVEKTITSPHISRKSEAINIG